MRGRSVRLSDRAAAWATGLVRPTRRACHQQPLRVVTVITVVIIADAIFAILTRSIGMLRGMSDECCGFNRPSGGVSTCFGEMIVHRNIDLDVERGQILGLVEVPVKTTLFARDRRLAEARAGHHPALFGQSVFDPDPVARRNLRGAALWHKQQGALFSAFAFDNIEFRANCMVWMKPVSAIWSDMQTRHGRA